ncbi:MAG: hypothetical protein K2M17_04840 [Bacilli bacterium]|nr:hypothetical protein [Bacilli bacterium]
MKKRVDWVLKSDSHVVVAIKGASADFYPEKEIIFYEDNIKNRIDLEKRIFERFGTDYTMTIDFKKDICSFVFSTEERCSFDIKTSFKETKTSVTLKYTLDDEIKEINVSWKE